MFYIAIILWLSLLTGHAIYRERNSAELKTQIKYLLPFVQDKTLKALTSCIKDDKNSSLEFNEHGDLIEKKEEEIQNKPQFFNEKFIPIPNIIKCDSIDEAIKSKFAYKLAKYRTSIQRQSIITCSSKVCLFWKPGTIFCVNNGQQIFILPEESNHPIVLHDNNEKYIGKITVEPFENWKNDFLIELLVLPEEYLEV